MLIDKTYFQGRLTLAQLDTDDTVANLNLFIQEREPEFLRKLFGYSLFNLFYTEVLGGDPIDERFENLLTGADFINCYTKQPDHYDGLTPNIFGTETKSIISPIADYIYFHFMRDQASQTTGSGEVMIEHENSNRVSAITKTNDAWNKMAKNALKLREYIKANELLYPEYPKDWLIPASQYRYNCRDERFRLPEVYLTINALNI